MPIIRMMRNNGFTLAELLLALVILGVIATFTIPKVLSSQQSSQFRAVTKESISAVSGAYDAYKQSNTPTSGMKAPDLSPYINYVASKTSGTIDLFQGGTSNACNAANPCLVMHNGSVLQLQSATFANTYATNAIFVIIDPDGKVTDGGTGDTSATAPGKSVQFSLYFTGRISDRGSWATGTCSSGGCVNPIPADMPPWFGWD